MASNDYVTEATGIALAEATAAGLAARAPGTVAEPPPEAPGKGENIVVGLHGAIADDVGTAAVLAGGSAGYENVIGGDTSTVNTSTPNEVTGGVGGDWSAIVAGYDNVVNGSACQVQGYHIIVESDATHATVSGGSLHTVTDGDYSTISGGTQNQIAAHQATIGGGSENVITDPAATRATIAGGGDNRAAGYAATVGGGDTNVASGTGAVVSGGGGNVASGNYATVAGGSGNAPSGNYATIAGGQNGTTSGSYSTIGGGTTNQATQANATVAGGQSNQATGNSATVGGGLSNTAGPGTAATVVGGRGNVAAGASATAIGREASASLEGQVAQASGFFTVAGDAQTSVLTLRRTTTDATVSELFLNGASGRLTLLADSTWAFSIMVVARRTDANGESAGYKFEGVCDRDSGGSTALVGTVTKTVLAEDTAAWDCDVDVDAATFSLRIRVTGEAAKTIRWVARVVLVQVVG